MSDSDNLHLDSYGVMVVHDLINARIVALFLESAFYGIFVVTYILGFSRLIRGHQYCTITRRNKIILAALTLMFILSTAHLALTIRVILLGFAGSGQLSLESISDGLDASDIFGSRASVAQFYIYVTQTLIGDGFMIYRMFVVWGRSRRVLIVPILLFFFDAVGGYLSHALTPFAFLLVFFGLSFITNMLSTALIMWRILRSNNLIQMHGGWRGRVQFVISHYHAVFEAIIQSAAIYSTASIALLVTLFISPNIGFVACLTVFPQIIGIVFSFIVIKIARKQPIPDLAHQQFSDRPPVISTATTMPSFATLVRPIELPAADLESNASVKTQANTSGVGLGV